MIKNVVITGKLKSMKRDDFEKLLNQFGVKLQKAISGTTDYLITNDPNSNSSKNNKADYMGIKKISELDFITLLKEEVKFGNQKELIK